MAKMKVNQELCIGCGACVDACPNEVFFMSDDGKSKVTEGKDCENPDECIGLCPVGAISVDE